MSADREQPEEKSLSSLESLLGNLPDGNSYAQAERELEMAQRGEDCNEDDPADKEVFKRKLRGWKLKYRRLNYELRKTFSHHIKDLAVSWVVFIACIILANATGIFPRKISDPVLIALIGGTSVNIIGLMWVVANNLFPNNKRSFKKKKPR